MAKLRDMRVTLHDRATGAVAYALPLFHRIMEPSQLIELLLHTGLEWSWIADVSGSDAGVPRTISNVPRRLTSETATEAVAHLAALDDDGDSNFVSLFGGTALVDSLHLIEWLTEFDAGRRSPIEMVIVQIDDDEVEYVFLPRPIHPAAQKLLDAFGCESTPMDRVRYSRLRTVSLKSLFRL